MSHLRRHRLPDGSEVWIDKLNLVVAPVRSGNSHEDAKEAQERVAASRLAECLGFDGAGLRRPTKGRHDFDAVDDAGPVALSVEVKRVTWPFAAMAALDQSRQAAFSLGQFTEEIRTDIAKAACQLLAASGAVKAVILEWSYEEDGSAPFPSFLAGLIAQLSEDVSPDIQVWITTP